MTTLNVDVLVIGAGPAGLAASLELRRLGVGTVLAVDREKEAGGIPRHCHHIGFGMRDLFRVMTGPAYAAQYVRLAQQAGVQIKTETTVTDWCGPTHLQAPSTGGLKYSIS